MFGRYTITYNNNYSMVQAIKHDANIIEFKLIRSTLPGNIIVPAKLY